VTRCLSLTHCLPPPPVTSYNSRRCLSSVASPSAGALRIRQPSKAPRDKSSVARAEITAISNNIARSVGRRCSLVDVRGGAVDRSAGGTESDIRAAASDAGGAADPLTTSVS